MTEKEKQIEEMAFSICPMPQASEYITDCTKCGGNGDCIRQKFAAKFLGKGYRKQSEVIDEFVERLKEENEISFRRFGKGIGISSVFKIADEMKIELFETE